MRTSQLWIVVLVMSGWITACSQGGTAAWEAPDLEPKQFEQEIRRFEFKDKVFPPEAGAIVFAGSSSFRVWNTEIREDMSPLSVVPRGFGGSSMVDLVYYMDRIVMAYKPRAVVVYEGDNDIGYYNMSPQDVLDQYKRFVKRVHDRAPEMRIYFLSTKPSIARDESWPAQLELNKLIEELCASDERLMYIDVATPMFQAGELREDLFIDDGLHMNAKGYELWRSIIRPILLQREGAYEAGEPTKAAAR